MMFRILRKEYLKYEDFWKSWLNFFVLLGWMSIIEWCIFFILLVVLSFYYIFYLEFVDVFELI